VLGLSTSSDNKCPACLTSGGDIVRRFSSERAATVFVLPQAEPERHAKLKAHLEHLWSNDHCLIRRCSSCGFGWAEPYVAGDQEFYALATPDSAYPLDRWEFRRTIGALDSLPATAGTELLEIGSGRGHFLRQLIAKGWPARHLSAIEFSDIGRRSIDQLGVRTQASDVRGMPGDALFDVICIFHVLEHMDGLDDLFGALARLLRPHGDLFLAVPDAAWTERNETTGLLLDMPPGHIGRWQMSAFRAFCHRLGWEIVEHAAEPEGRLEAARHALAWRYLRRAQDGARWPQITCTFAERLPYSARRLSKATAALLDPPCWLATAAAATSPSLPPSLWLHLRRQ
jgi:SAM-dependent methyltransferase